MSVLESKQSKKFGHFFLVTFNDNNKSKTKNMNIPNQIILNYCNVWIKEASHGCAILLIWI